MGEYKTYISARGILWILTNGSRSTQYGRKREILSISVSFSIQQRFTHIYVIFLQGYVYMYVRTYTCTYMYTPTIQVIGCC